MKATARPVARPMPASTSIHPVSCTMLCGTGWTSVQREYNAIVRPMASVILAASGPAFSPGKGRNTNIPEMRANTSRNPYSREAWTAALPGITRQIAKESN